MVVATGFTRGSVFVIKCACIVLVCIQFSFVASFSMLLGKMTAILFSAFSLILTSVWAAFVQSKFLLQLSLCRVFAHLCLVLW